MKEEITTLPTREKGVACCAPRQRPHQERRIEGPPSIVYTSFLRRTLLLPGTQSPQRTLTPLELPLYREQNLMIHSPN